VVLREIRGDGIASVAHDALARRYGFPGVLTTSEGAKLPG
jgi:hypothetical protein